MRSTRLEMPTSKAFMTANSVSLPEVKYTPNCNLGISLPLASCTAILFSVSNAWLFFCVWEKEIADLDCRWQRVCAGRRCHCYFYDGPFATDLREKKNRGENWRIDVYYFQSRCFLHPSNCFLFCSAGHDAIQTTATTTIQISWPRSTNNLYPSD